MIKTQGFRKFATLMAVIFGMTLFLAACGTDSSTDDALSQPGDDFVGTYKFDMDPANESMVITPVASAVSNTQVSISDGFAVTSGAATWAGGILSANVTVTNKSPLYRLENVGLRIFNSTDLTITTQADSTNINTPGQDNTACNVVGNLAAKLGNGACATSGGPGLQIVGDTGIVTYSATTAAGSGQWATPVYECVWTVGPCTAASKYRGLRAIAPGCTTGGPSVTTPLALGSAVAKYTFWSHLYAVKRPANLFNDPRYDSGNGTIILKAYQYGAGATPSYDPTQPLTTVLSGQWFALVVAADMPGDQSAGQMLLCADGNATAGCSVSAGALASARNQDYYFLEDAGNIAARDAAGGVNTGYTHLGSVVSMVQWDPAVIFTNDIGTKTCCGALGTRPGSGANAFTTTGGTSMLTIRNATNGLLNPRVTTTATQATNGQSRATVTGSFTYNIAGGFPPFLGDGFDGNDYSGSDVPADLVMGVLALRAIGPAGSGATITLSNTGNTVINIAMGNNSNDNTADTNSILQKGNRTGTVPANTEGWGIYGYATGANEGATAVFRGMYNDGILGLCIQ